MGERLREFVAHDPLTSEVREFVKLEVTKRWERMREHLLRYLAIHREGIWDGKQDVAALTEWQASLNHFFVTQPVLNSVAQSVLAVSTFRGHAQKWWFSKTRLYPRLVVSFDQLMEWVRMELVPTASPQKAARAW